MARKKNKRSIVVKRLPTSLLSDIVYGADEMPVELAETIRILRRDHGLRYEDLMWSLCQSEPDASQCYG